jgi:GT2 family glycosyltransferase
LARGDIIVSIDDDALFISPNTVAQTLRAFDHPRIGAVAIPYVEPKKSIEVFQRAPDSEAIYATDTFIGTAHAVRKDIFLKLAAYKEVLVHQGEESDYCIRMLDAGYIVSLGTADPIHHMESPQRSSERMDYYGARNNILFCFSSVPHPYFMLHLAGTTYKVATWTFTPSRQMLRLKAIIDGFKLGLMSTPRREPVSIRTYRLFRRLRKRKFELLERIEKELHPMNFEDE